jgi:hypothetical protein
MLHGKDALSIEVWFIPADATPASNSIIVEQYNGGANDTVQLYLNTTGNIVFLVGDGAGFSTVTSTGTVTAGQVHHVVGTWDKTVNSGKATVYLNNSSDDAAAGVTNAASCNANFYVARRIAGANYLDATILAVNVYNDYQLTAAEVEDLYLGELRSVNQSNWMFEMEYGYGASVVTSAPHSQVPGKWDRALNFTTNDYIDTNTVLFHGLAAFTAEAWIYRDATGAANHILGEYTAAGTNIQFYVDASENLACRVCATGGDITFASSLAVSTNTWHHAVLRWASSDNSGKIDLILDGTVETDGTGTTGTVDTGSADTIIGARTTGGYWWEGALQNVAVYSEKKSDAWVTRRISGFHVADVRFTDGADGVPKVNITLPNTGAAYDDLIKPNDVILVWMNDSARFGSHYLYSFAGRVWNIEYGAANASIELEWAADLARQYHGTYGYDTATTATKDVADLAADLLIPGYTSNKATETGVAGNITVSKGTHILPAIQQLMGYYPYIWGIDRFKDLYTLLRWDTAFEHDQHTEATTNWDTSAGIVDTTAGVFGSNAIFSNDVGVSHLRSPLVAVDNSAYDAVVCALRRSHADDKIILYTARTGYDVGTGWERTFGGELAAAAFYYCIWLLPESAATLHGWTEKGAPTYTDNIIYLELIAGDVASPQIDGWNFVKFKPAAEVVNSLTVSKTIQTGMNLTLDGYVSTSYVRTGAAGSPDTVAPAASYGTTENMVVDLSVATNIEAYNLGALDVIQRYAIPENETVTITIPFKLEYLNLRRGDTVQITEARANLSSFQASIIGIQHTMSETTLQVNAQPGMTIPRAAPPRGIDRRIPEAIIEPDIPVSPAETYLRLKYPPHLFRDVTSKQITEQFAEQREREANLIKAFLEASYDMTTTKDRRKYW